MSPRLGMPKLSGGRKVSYSFSITCLVCDGPSLLLLFKWVEGNSPRGQVRPLHTTRFDGYKGRLYQSLSNQKYKTFFGFYPEVAHGSRTFSSGLYVYSKTLTQLTSGI